MLCLCKEPEQRPESAKVLGEMLDNIEHPRRWTPARAEAWWRAHLAELTEIAPREREETPV